MTNIFKLKESSVERVLRIAAEENFDEIVLIGFSGTDYLMLSTELEKRSQTVGALEIIKHELLFKE